MSIILNILTVSIFSGVKSEHKLFTQFLGTFLGQLGSRDAQHKPHAWFTDTANKKAKVGRKIARKICFKYVPIILTV